MARRNILLIIGGGIAAYKCLELARRLGERDVEVRAVMTKAAQQFITPLSVSAITNDRVFTDLFDLNDEHEIGHIRLSRQADLIVVAPATADLIAKMAAGLANDLASTVLLATDKPVLIAPAMNPRMWAHPATRRNVAQIKADGVHVFEPAVGEMAEKNEAGPGRLPEVPQLMEQIERLLERHPDVTDEGNRGEGPGEADITGKLKGRHVLITSGPTQEPIDPIRYIANRSSGKQGHALATAAARAGARVTLITGPVQLDDPLGVDTIHVKTAQDMLDAVQKSLPADIAIFAAAVADWHVKNVKTDKIKKTPGAKEMTLALRENPDILKTVATLGQGRPKLIIGFAAETHDVVSFAQKKLLNKGADWIIANDVSLNTGVMGGDENRVVVITKRDVDAWQKMSKTSVALRLVIRAADHLRQIEKGNQDAAQ